MLNNITKPFVPFQSFVINCINNKMLMHPKQVNSLFYGANVKPKILKNDF